MATYNVDARVSPGWTSWTRWKLKSENCRKGKEPEGTALIHYNFLLINLQAVLNHPQTSQYRTGVSHIN